MIPPETRARAILDHPSVVARVARCGVFREGRTTATRESRKRFLEAFDAVSRVARLCPSMSPSRRDDPDEPDPREAAIAALVKLAKIKPEDLVERAKIVARREDAAQRDAIAWMWEQGRLLKKRWPPPVSSNAPAPDGSPSPWSCVPRDVEQPTDEEPQTA